MNLQSGEVSYAAFDPQRKTRRKLLLGCTGFVLIAGLVALICYLVIPLHGSDSTAETGYFQHDLFTVNNEDSMTIETDPGVSSHAPDERPLYQAKEPITLVYEIKNNYKEAKTVAIRDTPMESGEVLTNFFSHLPDVFFGGVITENAGGMYQFFTLQPKETKRVLVELDTNLLFAKFGEVKISLSYTLYMPEELGQPLTSRIPNVIATTNDITATVSKSKNEIDKPADRGHARRRATLRRRTEVFVGNDGIPSYSVDCIDDPCKTGFTYTGTDECVDCGDLRSKCSSNKAVKRFCPSVCNTCTAIEDSYSHPSEDKSSHVGHVTGSSLEECSESIKGADGRSQTEMEWIREAERLKLQFCGNILYHLQAQDAEMITNFREWFGVYDAQRWQKLRDGFTKICSADNYKFNCNPSAGLANDRCSIDFEWGGMKYTNWRQQDVVSNGIQQDFIDKCNSPTKCTYSGTVAWVSSGETFDRVINLCPIGFWIQEDQRGNDFSSKASVIIHELSHFVDMASTTDYTYDREEMRQMANTMSKDMLENAASRDNFSEDPDFSQRGFEDFTGTGSTTGGSNSGGNSSGGSSSGGSSGGNTSGGSSGGDSGGNSGGDSGGGGNSGGNSGGVITTTFTMKSSVYGGKCGDRALTQDLGAVRKWDECGSRTLDQKGVCSHMFYTNAHNGGTECGCVFEGEICSFKKDSDFAVFVVIPQGNCNDNTFKDRSGNSCSWYESNEYCYDGVIKKELIDYAAADACCACGGGHIV